MVLLRRISLMTREMVSSVRWSMGWCDGWRRDAWAWARCCSASRCFCFSRRICSTMAACWCMPG
jgi:hypothetical protein